MSTTSLPPSYFMRHIQDNSSCIELVTRNIFNQISSPTNRLQSVVCKISLHASSTTPSAIKPYTGMLNVLANQALLLLIASLTLATKASMNYILPCHELILL